MTVERPQSVDQLNALRGLILRPLSLIEARLGYFERAVNRARSAR